MRLFPYFTAILPVLIYSSLLAQESDTVTSLDSENDIELIIAADRGDTMRAAQLINMGADVNASTYEGVTSLMFAAQNGNLPMIRLLLSKGANPDKKPLNGYTALITAIRGGRLEITEYLIRKGADINLNDNDDVSPLMHAVVSDSFFMADMLLYYGANVKNRSKEGIDALMLASFMGRYETAVRLMEEGADINSSDQKGRTPLHYATEAGNLDLMELLIYNGAFLEARTNTGYTPLSLAVSLNNFSAAKLLIGYGADVNSRINASMNPLELAKENKNDTLVAMLMNHEAQIISRPNFNKITIGTRYVFNANDSQYGFTVGLSDKKHNIWIDLGYGFRPKAIRIFEKVEYATYYQYWEKRHAFSLSAAKGFMIPVKASGFRLGAFAGFKEYLTFGGYRGSSSSPDTRLLFSPEFGAAMDFHFLRLKLSYEFLNLHLEEINHDWFNISLQLLFSRKKGNKKITSINWL
jgi:ankyrin repeat protein